MKDKRKGNFVIPILMIGSKGAELLCDFSKIWYWQSMGKVATILTLPNNQY